MNDARVRRRYLDRTISLLFPGPGEDRPYSLLPHPLIPRRLTPRAWWHPCGRVMVPAGRDSIETHLSEVLGIPIRVTLHVRPARRANRKPVLEARGPDGTVAFVKIGDTDRTRELVAHEARTLAMLAETPLKTVIPPTVLHHGSWRDLSVLALSPLPVRRGAAGADLRAEAIREISGIGGERFAWHGDFSPWNIARGPDDRLLVWDWERFGTGVPLGFDALHHFLQRALRRMDPPTAARACVAQALPLLAPFGLSAGEARLTAVHYLTALAHRHAADGHEPLGPPAAWLNPVVDSQEVLV
ncbi:hypothetical protein Ppa06_29320 [Planomonospora parontospora subsp. parontospora]|uniref:Aminoglycoside phosphotransferase domain-containing protein n=2 Tax=Planomonospora parontospora TaxID=58119 RepID=A0AA37F4F9_9ACTN|nr:hypothetical protein [Planomonospora parontospora]GGK67646.1 hypothetical protein GCM10010126_28840 [Planomonospora parontospora]GII09134.1 hypothetical protein Ppa06_29320 [Planomonospora parontospora subsp. parontospora]